MLKLRISTIAVYVLVSFVTACTGGKDATTASPDQGGFRITPGDKIELDMTDLVELGFADDLTITLKKASDDFKSTTTLMDLTDFIVKTPSPDNHYKLILPKDIAGIRPMVLLVESPSLRAQFTDVFYADTTSARPGIASSLAYELLKYYPGKNLSNYTSSQFTGIKNLIQARIDLVRSQTEQLSLASVRFDRVMRFYKNSMAFNPQFLNDVAAFGTPYTFALSTPESLLASETPEGSLANYTFASHFLVNGSPAAFNPFNQTNNPARLSTATPGLGQNISAQEGSQVTLSAMAVDPDDDFIDKSFIIQYIPRKLPKNLPAGVDPMNLPIPEPTPSYFVKTGLGKPADPANYSSDVIGFNEAINSVNYKKGLLGNTPCDPSDTDIDCGDTAYKNIYMLVTDGMVQVPYRWNFKYVDINRSPKILADQYNHINSTALDDKLISQITGATSATSYGGVALIDGASPGFRQHASHCETDPDILEQNIRSRADGPWACVFKVYDPDLDADPNAAVDEFYYTVDNYESSTEILTNGLKISPSVTGPKKVKGAVLDTCVDAAGVTHRKCGLGLFSITVDNSVKVAAASKASLEYSYDAVVADRLDNGFQTNRTISRKIKFTPIPPRFVNFDLRTKPGALPEIGRTYSAADETSDPAKIQGTYARNDIYIDEVLANAKASSTDASVVGFKETFFEAANRPAFHFTSNGATAVSSSYLTQPHRVGNNTPTFDADANLTAFTAVIPRKLGNVLYSGVPVPTPADPDGRTFYTSGGNIITSFDPATGDTYDATSYSYPREYDRTCELDSNNAELNGSGDPIWDQRPIRSGSAVLVSGGWTFELDVVDMDNLDLRASEPYEPVYLSLAHDATSFGNSGLIQYCDTQDPNPDVNTYATYAATTSPTGVYYPGINQDACRNWINAAPQKLQPISVFYQKKNDDGSFENRKLVYHRIRMKWQPKDHEVVTNFIKNNLTNFMIYGDRYKSIPNKTDLEARQDISIYPSLELVAARKNHKPCVTFAQTTLASRYFVLHDANPVVSDMTFNVKDENRVGENGNGTAATGRYQAEIFPMGNNTVGLSAIDQVAFSRFAPFLTNCTSLNTIPVADPKPIVWYAGADKLPRTRLTSKSTVAPVTDYPFCVRYNYQAYRESTSPNRVYDKVALFQTTGAATLNLSTFVDGSSLPCFTEPSITFSATEKYALLATPCSGISYSSGGITGTTLSNFDPTLAANGSFPAGTALKFKLFPSLYAADYGAANDNTLRMSIAGVDSFVYDTVSGLNQAIDVLANRIDTVVASNLGQISPPLPSMDSSAMFGYVDWDHQPTSISVVQGETLLPTPTATPVPNASTNVFYRVNSSGVLQIFSKGTSAAVVPIQAVDTVAGSGLPAHGLESDPYDIFQYSNLQPVFGAPSAASNPTFGTPAGRSSCIDAPTGSGAGYFNNVVSGLLSYATLDQYRRCNLLWTPAAADVGNKYNYQFYVQDNYGATANINNVRTAFGIGARHPTGSSPPAGTFFIQNDSWSTVHGPYSIFNVQMESIEANLPPYFVDTTGSTNAQRYCTAVSTATGCTSNSRSANWVSIFGGTGLQPACSSSAGFACPAATAGESVQEGDTIITQDENGDAYLLTEGGKKTITVLVRDDNITSALKTVSAAAPRKVLVVTKNSSVKNYVVPQWATMSLGVTSTTQTDGKTSTTFSFDWTPSDAEAFQLSNADGFLIPFVVSDQDYTPALDAGFPDDFKVKKITRTIWVWARLKVKNIPSLASYVDPATNLENPLSGATLTFETGVPKTYVIRIRDADRARFDLGTDSLTANSFSATATSKPSFLTDPAPSPAPAMTKLSANGSGVYQEFTISNNRVLTPTDIGLSNYEMNVTDPGDLSKCWVDSDVSSCTPGARATIADSGVGFNIQVVGKPFFLVPHTDTNPAENRNTAHVFVNSTSNPTIFNYPLALSISKEAEKGGTFFFGIDGVYAASIPMRTTVPPASTPAPLTSKGIYINENSVVKWPDASFDRVGSTITVPVAAILSTYCGSGTAVVLYRFNEASNAIETCGLSQANADNNLAKENLAVTVHNNYDVPPLANINTASAVRISAYPAATSAKNKAAAGFEYSAFKGRCTFCSSSPTTSGASPSGLLLNPSADSGNAHFSVSNYENDFHFDWNGSSTTTITRTYGDAQASTASRRTTFPVVKGDTATFSATVSSVPTIHAHYRWYVNGCLKKAGEVATPTVSFDLPITILMSGLNNDCTGEYSIAETDSGRLGALKVRLNIVNNIENTTYTSDGATKTYLWDVTVLNNKPNLQPGLKITSYNGNLPVTLAMPVSFNSKSYLAFVDVLSSAGAAFRMQEIQNDGCISETNVATAVRSSITSQPTVLGVQTSPSLKVAMSNITTYPSSSSEAATVFKTSSRSYGVTYASLTSPSAWNIAQAYNDVAGFSAFSKHVVSSMPQAYFQTAAGYFDSSSATNFYLIDGQDGYGYRGVRQYWQNNINSGASVYGGNTSPLSNGSSGVRRNIVYNSTLFQLIGAKSSSANGAVSSINIRSLSTSSNLLTSSNVKKINFSASGSAPDCKFDGTPIDGTYVPAVDTLFVLAYGSDGVGRFVSITNATNTSASCTILPIEDGKPVANPSLNNFEFNPNLSKSALDTTNNFVYGIINRTSGQGAQIYYIDAFASRVYVQDISNTINPSALIYSKEQNAVLLLDGDKTATKVPTLYKIW
jgi:hypothetical protein